MPYGDNSDDNDHGCDDKNYDDVNHGDDSVHDKLIRMTELVSHYITHLYSTVPISYICMYVPCFNRSFKAPS